MNERRISRLQEQIKQRLAEILQRDLADPKLGLVTISRIELDAEFTQCKAYWSVMAPTPVLEHRARRDSEEVLKRARGYCQREVGRELNTRTIPHLMFIFDEGLSGSVRMNQLLKDLEHERALRGPDPTTEPAADAGPGATPDSGNPPPVSPGTAPGTTP